MDSPYDSCLFYSNPEYDNSNATYFNTQQIKTGEINGTSMVLLRKSTLKEPVSINDPERYGVNSIQPIPEEFFNRFKATGLCASI